MFKDLKHYSHILLPLFLLTAIIILGTTGYHFLCNYPYIDAFYMTVSTVATVGFGEVHPLNEAGRLFTSFLIFGFSNH